MAFPFVTPGRTVFGEGALETCEKDLLALGQKALVVTGNVVKKGDAYAKLIALLQRLGIGYAAFSDIPAEPDDTMVDAGASAYVAGGCDFLIGLGGGSPLDCAKAIAVKVALPGNVCDHAGIEITGALPPFALIPTTAGTGSEATKFTVITDHARGAKLLLKGDVLLPRLAVVDYTFTLSSPPALTVATGLDALTHAVEAYTSRKANAMTDPLALDATRRIFSSLPAAYADGGNTAARESMAIAAYEAGVSICNASVTLVHGMSRPIGARFHVPHGLSNAMLLTVCLRFAAQGATERFAKLAREVGFAGIEDSNTHASQALVEKLAELTSALKVPTLAQYGVAKNAFTDAIPQMALEAQQSGSPGNTLREVTQADMIDLYHQLY